MIKKAIYAGTFDPFTNGHQDILIRSLELFEEVTILIAISPTKQPLSSMEDRVAMLKEHFKNEPKIKVDSWDGLVVDYARKHKIGAMLRGLRPTGDFEIEFQMASMNQKLYPDLETVFLMTRGKHYFISSTLVKEIFHHGGDISEFVPPTIAKYLVKK
ncbi:MAG: pantetheine-phosphate adenylyltransferase [Bdellovibrio sp. CG12_big_fil_rev_8_21_14_0_65_39_13]|nr:MAG: pantetheine-phosphate adenylyltransferase [Bdellovibrio sp. CG22_combo_CG10-13_8_21_14_all_39_27]PIQ57886.1 MAG: pantetheine-phosphate adenylyltransferase [Bdellovibrio sp. CG12_big_fil_rev_8_21_14_0_65_39_13]PIR34555.1 MAG: pantetheine-phosphate adenylyltransferase [Bdellovibrio sp. CG11_big_fil_rev_8_21_14_0_20_39_38]PJB52387.1 MAG: pantetheine-phosphate adenylyltransferase [Bdellovibrio sp. CG_4_9_14_3_um_filter_39_7]